MPQTYENLIKNFLTQEFPLSFKDRMKSEDMVDILASVFVSTKENRIGPAPSPETLVTIRDIIRTAIKEHRPLPVLSKWGALKRGKYDNLDVADIIALRQFERIQEAIQRIYSPGIEMSIVAEDLGGYAIYGESEEPKINIYHNNLIIAAASLGIGKFASINRKTSLMTERGKCIDTFLKDVQSDTEVLAQYLTAVQAFGDKAPDVIRKRLRDIGWNGEIPFEQRNFYYESYKRNYPNITPDESVRKLATYFAQALGKYKYGIRGDYPQWGGKFIYVSLVPPVPGAPERLDTVYWRSLPASFSHINLAPWRAKGYLEISNDNQVIPKVTTGYNANQMQLEHCAIPIGRVLVETDYLIK